MAAPPYCWKAIPRLRRYSYAERVRFAAAQAVGGLGTAAATPEFLGALARLLQDAEGRVRFAAAGETVTRDRLAANFERLPTLGPQATREQLSQFITGFFAELATRQSPQVDVAAEAVAL